MVLTPSECNCKTIRIIIEFLGGKQNHHVCLYDSIIPTDTLNTMPGTPKDSGTLRKCLEISLKFQKHPRLLRHLKNKRHGFHDLPILSQPTFTTAFAPNMFGTIQQKRQNTWKKNQSFFNTLKSFQSVPESQKMNSVESVPFLGWDNLSPNFSGFQVIKKNTLASSSAMASDASGASKATLIGGSNASSNKFRTWAKFSGKKSVRKTGIFSAWIGGKCWYSVIGMIKLIFYPKNVDNFNILGKLMSTWAFEPAMWRRRKIIWPRSCQGNWVPKLPITDECPRWYLWFCDQVIQRGSNSMWQVYCSTVDDRNSPGSCQVENENMVAFIGPCIDSLMAWSTYCFKDLFTHPLIQWFHCSPIHSMYVHSFIHSFIHEKWTSLHYF